MLPIHLIIQKELLRDRALGLASNEATVFSSDGDWKTDIEHIEKKLTQSCRPLVISSIQICEHIRRNNPFLARGVIANFETCRFSRSMMTIPRHMRLNDDFILMPFGEIRHRVDQIGQLFGERIFVRPDDSRKSFTGFCTPIARLASELDAVRQIQGTREDEICVIDKGRDFKRTEFRSWLINGQIASIAPYSHYGPTLTKPSDKVFEAARALAAHMEMIDDAIVADFAILENGEVRIVELNAPSTSGIYPVADLSAIVRSFEDLLV